MGLKLIAAPAAEPIALAEAKLHLRVESDITADDTLITALIVAARQLAEQQTGRALISQQWEQTFDSFPAGDIELDLPPLVSVASIKYVDNDGTLQTLAESAYTVQTSAPVGIVSPAYNTRWPDTREQHEAVVVAFTAGYANAAAVPQPIKQWMLLCIGGWYAYREQIVTGTIVAELPRGMWDCLLDAFRVQRFA